ncbi:MAG: hypothetical protein Q4C96_08905 [Planctomycetia bacterium]|nr:hypothetical protein [Planctomycetia bacterium]
MRKNIYRIVTKNAEGKILVRDFLKVEEIGQFHDQIGVDDCSIHHGLRGLPIYRGLIGPMAEGPHIIRYEAPDVFEVMTKEWIAAVPVRRRGHVKRNM